jgi:hypothetical protein
MQHTLRYRLRCISRSFSCQSTRQTDADATSFIQPRSLAEAKPRRGPAPLGLRPSLTRLSLTYRMDISEFANLTSYQHRAECADSTDLMAVRSISPPFSATNFKSVGRIAERVKALGA